MIIKAAPAVSLLKGETLSPLFPASNVTPPFNLSLARRNGALICSAKSSNNKTLTGVIFKPFEEVKKGLNLVPAAPRFSLARHKYTNDCEASINEQINVEYNVSYVYHAMYAYFDRDNVALRGIVKFFKESSKEERDNAENFMEY